MIVTITNQKGGVGKTTTAHTLACGLLQRDKKVLMVDTDPQMNLTFTAGIRPENINADLYDLFKGKRLERADICKASAGFDIIAGSLEFTGADMEFNQMGREYLLKEILEPIKDNYDYIIIDTPPTLGVLTANALTVSDCLIVPMAADIYSLQGLSRLQKFLETAKKRTNPNLYIDGLLLTKYSPRAVINRHLKEAVEEAAKQLNTKVYKTPIREAVAVKEVQFMQSDIFKDYPTANVTQDYNEFIIEFLKGKE